MAVVYSLCAAYVAYCLATNPAGAITTPDSIRYLEVWPNYPLGYPLFLKIVGVRGAIVAQPIIFGAALAYCGRGIVRLTRSTWLAATVIVAVAALPQIREFHASILSESLFISLGMVFLGFTLRFAYHPTWQLLAVAALTAGSAATIRRTAFAFVPLMLIMVLLERHRLKGSQLALLLVAALAPFAVIVGAEQVAAPIVHAGHPSSLTGRHLFAKAALIEAAPAFARATAGQPAAATDPVRAALDEQLERAYAPIRGFLASAPADIRGVLSIYYETCLQGGCADEARALTRESNEADQTRTMGAAGIARIRRAPLGFLDLTWMNYLSLWTIDRLHHPDRADRLTQFIAAHRPMPFERMAFSLEPDQRFAFEPSPRVRYMQWAVTTLAIWTAMLAVSGLAALARPSRFPPLLKFASGAALLAHGGLLLTALLAAGFSRFTLGLWPAIVTAAITGAYCAVMLARPFRNTNF